MNPAFLLLLLGGAGFWAYSKSKAAPAPAANKPAVPGAAQPPSALQSAENSLIGSGASQLTTAVGGLFTGQGQSNPTGSQTNQGDQQGYGADEGSGYSDNSGSDNSGLDSSASDDSGEGD